MKKILKEDMYEGNNEEVLEEFRNNIDICYIGSLNDVLREFFNSYYVTTEDLPKIIKIVDEKFDKEKERYNKQIYYLFSKNN